MATSSGSRIERLVSGWTGAALVAVLLSAPLCFAVAQTGSPIQQQEQQRPTTPPQAPTPAPPAVRQEPVPQMPAPGGVQPGGQPGMTPSDVLHNTERQAAPPSGGGGTIVVPGDSGGVDTSGQIRDLGKAVDAQNAKKAPEKKTVQKTQKKTVPKQPAARSTVRIWEGVPVDSRGRRILRQEKPGVKPPAPAGGGNPPAAAGGSTPEGGTPPTPGGEKKGGGTTAEGGTPAPKEGGEKAGGGTTTGAGEGGEKPKVAANAWASKNVPIPPPWGDDRWKKGKKLKGSELWILGDNGESAEVWSYRPGKGEPGEGGLCVALPRYDRDGKLFAMGIICQSKDGYACFWDVGAGTIDKPGDPKQLENPKGLTAGDIPDDTKLSENCTLCHRGSNVFIVHDSIPSIGGESDTPYKPVAGGRTDQAWENSAADDTLAPKCQTCHILPKLTKEYCEAVLKPALTKPTEKGGKVAMPPPDENPAGYKDDIEQLRKACKELGVDL